MYFRLGTNFRATSLSNAERSGACIEGCGLARIRRRDRILRYAFAPLRLLRLLLLNSCPQIEMLPQGEEASQSLP